MVKIISVSGSYAIEVEDDNIDCIDCLHSDCKTMIGFNEILWPVNVEYAPEDECDITKEDLEMVNEFPVRLQEWWNFSDDVEEHIQEYTIPQYGDYPQDQLTTTTNECIVHDMKRYLNRFGKGQRGIKEAMRDMLKVAQYAGVLYNRLQQEQGD